MLRRITKWAAILVSSLAASLVLASAVQADGKKQIVFIRYPIALLHFQTVVDNFKRGMAAQGFQEGTDVEYIDILTASAGRDSVPEVRAAVRKYRDTADMFITCGWVSLYAREMLKGAGVPQLFVPVLRSVALEMLPSVTEKPDTNLSGLYLMYPPEKILRIARLILPELKRYAYIYDSGIPADTAFKKAYQDLPQEKRHDIEIVFLDLASGGKIPGSPITTFGDDDRTSL